jgi:hypothetical protein
MFLIALGAQGLARWDRAEGVSEAKSKGFLTEKLSQEARQYERDARIENGFPGLHRQVDTQGLVFVKTETISTRAVASPYWNRLAAHAY